VTTHTHKRRLPFLLALLALLLPLIAACGGTPSAESPTTGAPPAATAATGAEAPTAATSGEAPTAAGAAAPAGPIAFWTEWTAGGEATGIDELAKIWNAAHPDAQLNHRPINNEEFFTVVRTGLASGEPPDLMQYEGYQQTRDFAKAGQLTDLTDLWNKVKGNFDLQDAGEAACTYEGKVYCIPYTFATGWQIYYNPDLLKQYNIAVPTNYDEFLAAAETLKSNGVIPIALGNKNGWPGEHWWMAFLVQRCGVEKVYQMIQRQGASFTDACVVQATTDFQNLSTKGYLSPGAVSEDYGAAQAVFLSGKAAFFQTGSWFASGWESDKPGIPIEIMPFPRFTDAANTTDVTGAVTHVIAIPASAKNKEGAMALLEWLVTPEAAQVWAKNGNLSMVTGAVDAAAPPVVKDLWSKVKAAPTSLPWIENELPPGVGEDKIYNGTVAILSGSMTPQDFAKSIEDATAAAQGQ
jgi:raffinose/stachyose/melibiose transport system substrate-binding protein